MSLLGAGLLSMAGLGLWLALRKLAKPDLSETTLLALMLGAPVLALAASGALSELSAFGVTTKFKAAANAPVAAVSQPVDKAAILAPVAAADLEAARLDASFQMCRPVVAIRATELPPERREATVAYLAMAVSVSMTCEGFVGVVVLDERDRYLGSFPPAFFHEAGAIWTLGGTGREPAELGRLIMARTVFGAALAYPEARLKSGEGRVVAINRSATLAEAYALLRKERFSFAAVTDETGRAVGYVTRDAIQHALQDALTRPAP